jgi:hypothetical protein
VTDGVDASGAARTAAGAVGLVEAEGAEMVLAAGGAALFDGEGAETALAAGGSTAPVGAETSPVGGAISTAVEGVAAASCALASGV